MQRIGDAAPLPSVAITSFEFVEKLVQDRPVKFEANWRPRIKTPENRGD